MNAKRRTSTRRTKKTRADPAPDQEPARHVKCVACEAALAAASEPLPPKKCVESSTSSPEISAKLEYEILKEEDRMHESEIAHLQAQLDRISGEVSPV